MKDDDTKTLETLYDNIGGAVSGNYALLNEAISNDDILEEGRLVDTLGMNTARMLIGLVKRDLAGCNGDANCEKRFEKVASSIINSIIHNVDDTMIRRTLSQHEGIPATSKAKILYALLSR